MENGIPTTKIRTVMFLDLVNYTKTTSQLTREEFNNLHNTFDTLTIPIIEKNEGKIIQKVGDAFFATFESATDAVRCGMNLQNRFSNHRKDNPKERYLHIRIALHTGEVILRNDDVHGDTVNITARIESIVHSNHIVLSEAVYQSMNKNEIPFLFLGRFRFKGVNRAMPLFRVLTRQEQKRRKR